MLYRAGKYAPATYVSTAIMAAARMIPAILELTRTDICLQRKRGKPTLQQELDRRNKKSLKPGSTSRERRSDD